MNESGTGGEEGQDSHSLEFQGCKGIKISGVWRSE